jgi:hypothetical protein
MKRSQAKRSACALAALTVLAGCGGGSMFGSGSSGGSSMTSGITSRFSQLFGSNSQEVGTPSAPQQSATGDLTCPSVSVRPGASTLAVGLPGKPASGMDLRYQLTLSRTARACDLTNGQVTAQIGVEGRVVVGPAGAPPTVDVPLRVAVVQEGVNPKTVFTKLYKTTVNVSSTSEAFSIVAEDVVYPAPTPAANDSYIFYVGFDPQGLAPEPRAKNKRK